MMLDDDIVAASPSSVYRVLKQAGRLDRNWRKPSKKGTGFVQPLKPHEHWHIDVAHINIGGTFFFLCSLLDGFSRYIVHWELRETMKEWEVETIVQRGLEKFPGVTPRIISDNGPQFIARDFKSFVRIQGLTHFRTSPYYPQSNGKLERWHASLKQECIRPKCPESLDEARDLAARAAAAGLSEDRPLRVLLRLNPGIEPGTHAGLAVGRATSKFGMDRGEFAAAARELHGTKGLRVIGVHLHAGSQLTDQVAWRAAVDAALSAYAGLAASGLLDDTAIASDGTLCVGGGLPVDLGDEEDLRSIAATFAATCAAAWTAREDAGDGAVPPVRAIEPGRALVAGATILVARVLHVRSRHERIVGGLTGLHGSQGGAAECERQVIIDAGMTEIARPALYEAWHPIVALDGGAAADDGALSAVHGPICESTDALGVHLLPRPIARGDLVAILGTGAYADAMRSPYNGRPSPARLTLERDGSVTIDRPRGAETEGSPPTRQ